MALNRTQIEEFFMGLQDDICAALEQIDGGSVFIEDLWQRPDGGGGRSRVIQNGDVFEKGGVNFSAVHGVLPENIRAALKVEGTQFYATGISIVIHPQNPFVPIIHMNTRYFEIADETYWFGGGIDVTPHYVVEEDARFFHGYLKKVCEGFDAVYYSEFKKWADDYFFIKHRNETRGIGGIFFDRLKEGPVHTKQGIFEFVQAVGNSFVPIYSELVARGKGLVYTEAHKEWQFLRRGRYVEFNLVYDKGTKFGLDTSGRTESILMSLPSTAKWQYNVIPAEGSLEAKTLDWLKKGIHWV